MSRDETQNENLPNPMMRELNAVNYHLEQTRQQLHKMTDLVELLSKHIVEMSSYEETLTPYQQELGVNVLKRRAEDAEQSLEIKQRMEEFWRERALKAEQALKSPKQNPLP